MTLTDIMPTLRMSIPDPIDMIGWPPGTAVTTNDVLVENLSMLRVAGLLGTPCEWSTETTSPSGCRHVIVCTVSALVHEGDGPIALVDCDVARIGAVWAHARLINRISVAYKGSFRLLGDGSRPETVSHRRPAAPADTRGCSSVSLPRDLTVGDLVIVPCLPTPEPTVVAAPAATPSIRADAART